MPIGIELAIQIALAIHAAKTGRMQPWLYILFIPVIGPLLYVIMELGPDLLGTRKGREIASNLGRSVAPLRAYTALARAVEIAPTVHNRLRLAEECLALNRADEAVALYHQCAQGLHATDPAIRLGLARAQFAAGDPAASLATLDTLRDGPKESRTAEGHLLYAQALDACGRTQEALAEYRVVAGYYPGEEGRVRYADLLSRTGDAAGARAQYQEVVRRVELQRGPYKAAQREWYDEARRAVAP